MGRSSYAYHQRFAKERLYTGRNTFVLRKVGVAKRDNLIDYSLLEWCIREDLNQTAPRYMAVLDPIKVILTNYPDDNQEYMKASINPEDPSAGERSILFSKELYIERDDFMEDPPKKFFRLRPGGEVRLKYGYIIRCDHVVKDKNGDITALHCTYDPDTKPGAGTWRSVKGTIHWLCARHAAVGQVRLFDKLFTEADMGAIPQNSDYKDFLNPQSLMTVQALIDKDALALAMQAQQGKDHTRIRMQFERLGYFVVDYDSTSDHPVFNRICTLRDSYAKALKKG